MTITAPVSEEYIKDMPHFASTKAMKDTRIISIRRQEFLDFMDRNPAVASSVID
jgi:CRP-like cAMP-binding protein